MLSRYIDFDTCEYPSALNKLSDRPKRLYFVGNIAKLNGLSLLAIVGSRKMSPYGSDCIRHILDGFNYLPNLGIVSGFVHGVDAYSHSYAINKGYFTAGIMPGGVDVIPLYMHDLYDSILNSGGCLISEYPFGTKPCKWMFARRNRLIACLAKAVIVIEAAIKSGSIITAEYARKYNVPVYAVPGNIFSFLSEGTLHLLKSFAKPVTCSFDIKEIPAGSLFGNDVVLNQSGNRVSTKHLQILNCLKTYTGLSSDELSEKLNLSSREVSIEVSNLISIGLVEDIGGSLHAIQS